MYFDELLKDEKYYSFPPSSKTISFAIRGRNYLSEIRTNSEDISESIRALYRAMIVSNGGIGSFDPIVYCHFKEPGRYIITRNGKFAYSFDQLSDAVPRFDWMLMSDIVDHNRHLSVIHASAIVREGKTIIFAGESGNGKSILSLMMALEGWKFISDDIIFFDKAIHGVPRAFCLPENWAEGLTREPMHLIRGVKRGRSYVYMDPLQINIDFNRTGVAISHIFFLKKSLKVNRLKRLSPADTLQRLIENLFDTNNFFKEKLDILMDEVEKISGAELVWCDMLSAINMVKEFVGGDR